MHSIYHGSTLTLAALDARNPSQGLFIPKVPFLDIIPLQPAFGDGRGQAYVGPPTWNAYTHAPGPLFGEHSRYYQELDHIFSHSAYIQSGILETRGWAMQELRLSKRVLYFFKGEMMWKCTGATWRQNGSYQPVDPMFHLSDVLAKHGKAFKLVRTMMAKGMLGQATGKRKRLSSGDEIDKVQDRSVNSTEIEPQATTVNKRSQSPDASSTTETEVSDGEDESDVSDGKDDYHDMNPFEQAKTVFYEVLRHSKGRNIQEAWYQIIDDYSESQLTLQEDKLPALSGMASRFHAITKDDYLAGHWRIDLERSLFWEGLGPNAFRVKPYRAPTWSWASIDGKVSTDRFFEPDFSAPVEMLDAWVQVEGENPSGRVVLATL